MCYSMATLVHMDMGMSNIGRRVSQYYLDSLSSYASKTTTITIWISEVSIYLLRRGDTSPLLPVRYLRASSKWILDGARGALLGVDRSLSCRSCPALWLTRMGIQVIVRVATRGPARYLITRATFLRASVCAGGEHCGGNRSLLVYVDRRYSGNRLYK